MKMKIVPIVFQFHLTKFKNYFLAKEREIFEIEIENRQKPKFFKNLPRGVLVAGIEFSRLKISQTGSLGY